MSLRSVSIAASVAATLSGLVAASAPALAAFSCPVPDASAGGDSIDLTAVPLPAGGASLPQAVRDAIGRMQASNEGNARIVDGLVNSYCRRVAGETGLSDGAKAAAVERFAGHVARFVYSTPSSSEEDILVDVPVPYDTFNQLASAAKTAKMSQDAWINAAIVSALATK